MAVERKAICLNNRKYRVVEIPKVKTVKGRWIFKEGKSKYPKKEGMRTI